MTLLSRRQALAGMTAGAGLLAVSGCAVNPVTGKPEFMLMSEAAEIELGRQSNDEIIASYGVYDDKSMQGWFTERGKTMAALTQRPGLPWNFVVLDSPVVNAFAVPGGYVYVTRGILAYFNDEAQFAGVLAHELGHVNARHSAAKYSQSQLASLTLNLGSLFSEEFAQYAQLASAGVSLLFLKYSRDDERQADRLGVEYSSKAGYDAVEMSTFFSTLERMSPSGGSLPAWASTHPDPGDRINATRSQALAYQKKTPGTYVIKRNEYLERVNGIVFGDDPRQGYVKDGSFIHPGLGFRFPVPSGWKLTNSPSEVTMNPGSAQDAALIFMPAKGATPQAAATDFATANKVTVTGGEQTTVNGLTTYRTTGTMDDGSGNQNTLTSWFILYNGKVMAFHGLTVASKQQAYSGLFAATAGGFGPVKDKALLTVTPKKVEVRQVAQARTLDQALNGFGIPAARREEMAILNGLKLTDNLPAGTRIKITA